LIPHMQEKSHAPVAGADPFAAEAHRVFTEVVLNAGYPCVGARAAVNGGTYRLSVYDELGARGATESLACDLLRFAESLGETSSEYETLIAVFRGPAELDEAEFEQRLWAQLCHLNEIDAARFEWDPNVSSNPADSHFSFSFAGRAFYVIGMHASSSRDARKFPWPTLVFNPHEQFERLRSDGKWKRMQETIRARDVELQGNVNPMLNDFGDQSEARQYSGRAVEANWQPPFSAAQNDAGSRKIGKCPFAH
jgi:FPC/CPF motif-containing protein YcgG